MKLTIRKSLFIFSIFVVLFQTPSSKSLDLDFHCPCFKRLAEIQTQAVTIKAVILFCDIRNFSGICEQNSSQVVMSFLNAYFSEITEIVTDNNGIIDKFLGDGVMAVYPIDLPNCSAKHSISDICQKAIDSATKITTYAKSIDLSKFGLKQNPGVTLKNGIGITYGEVAAGILGTPRYYEYTFIGDTVNMASRLQDLNKDEKYNEKLTQNIIISSDVHQNLTETYKSKFSSLGEVSFKGKQNRLNIFGFTAQNADKITESQ